MGCQISHDHTPALDSMQSLREETHPRLPCPPGRLEGRPREASLELISLTSCSYLTTSPQAPSPLPGGDPGGPHQFNAIEQIFYPHLLCVKDESQPQVCTNGSGSAGEVHWDDILLKHGEGGTQPGSGCSGPSPSPPTPQH